MDRVIRKNNVIVYGLNRRESGSLKMETEKFIREFIESDCSVVRVQNLGPVGATDTVELLEPSQIPHLLHRKSKKLRGMMV